MGKKKLLLILTISALLSFACAYIVVPADLLVTPTSTGLHGWSGLVTNIEETDAGDLHIEISIKNDTQDWSAMNADKNKPAILLASDGQKTNCDTVFVGTGETRLAPGFQVRGYTAGTKKDPQTQLLFVDCKGGVNSSGAKLTIEYTYITGAYDLHIPSVPITETMILDLDQVTKDLQYPVSTPVAGLVEKIGDKISAINSFSLLLTDAKRTATGLELFWQAENPSDYPNYVYIGTPPVVGADGVIYGVYENPSIAEATIALPKHTAEWTTTVTVPNDVTNLYVMVSVETRQSKYFVSHVIDITDR
jgi:hypothetical protein